MVTLKSEKLALVVSHLQRIGIGVQVQDTAKGFLPHIRIQDGGIIIDPQCSVGDLLHEAGHLAIIPKKFRHKASGNIGKIQHEMLEYLDNVPLDSPMYRSIMQTGDGEATAWAFAFGKHLGLSDEEIIENDSYQVDGIGTGEEIRLGLAMGAYLGINGLAHAGFCSVNGRGALPKYPKLAFWINDLE